MSNRHLSRTIAMQTLYEWDFNHRSQKLADVLDKNLTEQAAGLEDTSFVSLLVKGVVKNLPEIDQIIIKYAPDWPIEKITVVDRNILRLGIFELKFSNDKELPAKVIINEAIETAKTFGGESSGKFINGVLGAVYAVCNDLAKPSQASFDNLRTMPKTTTQEISAGGVVYYQDNQNYYFVLIKDGAGKWTFPKGHVETGEDLEKTALREVSEEIGLKKLKIKDKLGSIEIVVNEPNKAPRPKRVFFFLMQAKDRKVSKEDHPGVREVAWFIKQDVGQVLGYENSKEIFKQALSKLKLEILF